MTLRYFYVAAFALEPGFQRRQTLSPCVQHKLHKIKSKNISLRFKGLCVSHKARCAVNLKA